MACWTITECSCGGQLDNFVLDDSPLTDAFGARVTTDLTVAKFSEAR